VVSKLLERIVFCSSLSAADFCHACSLLTGHTATVVLKVLTGILYAVDDDDLSVLALLDLSAAFDFDTVDHDILLTRLKVSVGISGAALDWFQSYLTSRVECVRRGSARSTQKIVQFGVPQGFVLGPLLFILYTAGLIEGYGLHSHLCRRHADTRLVSPWGGRPASVHTVSLPRRSV